MRRRRARDWPSRRGGNRIIRLVHANAGLLVAAPDSVDAAEPVPAICDHVDGQRRDAKLDVGADEFVAG